MCLLPQALADTVPRKDTMPHPPAIRRSPASLPSAEPQFKYGDRFEDYLINGFAGSGATSHVYRARRADSFEPVALKILHPHLLGQPGKRERFLREARMMMNLAHPNVVRFERIVDPPEAKTLAFVMEYIEGATLSQWQQAQGQGLSEVDLACIFVDILRGLHHAHRQGIVHRDLKPANILITHEEGRYAAKIIDFGVARHLDEPLLQDDRDKIVGTAAYISPEEIHDPLSVCPSSDLYSIGIMLYESACGQRPFHDLPIPDLMDAHCTQDPQPPRHLNPALTPAFESVILRTLEKAPTSRFATAPQMMRALELALQGIMALDEDAQEDTTAALTTEWHRTLIAQHAAPQKRHVTTFLRRCLQTALHLLSSPGLRDHPEGDPHHLRRPPLDPGWPL